MIVLRAKNVDFEVTYINLRDKPDWFLELSPHGKVPMLQVDGRPLFESNAIAEYLDEKIPPRLHPEDAFQRARHRAWNDFVPIFASGLGGVSVADLKKREEALEVARRHVGKLEQAISDERDNEGPFFSGPDLCLVDASYAPFLMRFSMVEPLIESGLMADFPRVSAWMDALVDDPRVRDSVPEQFNDLYMEQMTKRLDEAA